MLTSESYCKSLAILGNEQREMVRNGSMNWKMVKSVNQQSTDTRVARLLFDESGERSLMFGLSLLKSIAAVLRALNEPEGESREAEPGTFMALF